MKAHIRNWSMYRRQEQRRCMKKPYSRASSHLNFLVSTRFLLYFLFHSRIIFLILYKLTSYLTVSLHGRMLVPQSRFPSP